MPAASSKVPLPPESVCVCACALAGCVSKRECRSANKNSEENNKKLDQGQGVDEAKGNPTRSPLNTIPKTKLNNKNAAQTLSIEAVAGQSRGENSVAGESRDSKGVSGVVPTRGPLLRPTSASQVGRRAVPLSRPPLARPEVRVSRLTLDKSSARGKAKGGEWSRIDFIHDSAANTHACNVRWAFVPGSLEKCSVLLSGIEGGSDSEHLVARERGAVDYPLSNGDFERVFGVLYTPEANLAVESGAPSVLFSTGLLARENAIGSNFKEGGNFLELTRKGKIYPEIESSCPGLYVDQQVIQVSSRSDRRVMKNEVRELECGKSEESESNYYDSFSTPENEAGSDADGMWDDESVHDQQFVEKRSPSRRVFNNYMLKSQCVKSDERGSNYYYPLDTSSESETESETEDGGNDVSAEGNFGKKNKPLNKQKSSSKLAAKQRRKSAKANGRKKRQLVSSRLGSERVQKAKRSVEKRKELQKLLHARIHPGKTQPILRALNKAYNEIFNLHDEPCDACCFAKGEYVPVKTAARRRAMRVGERLHYDIFTAGVRSSRFGVKYLLVIIDEFSDYVWSFPLKKKSEAGLVLRSLVSHIEKKLAKRVENVEWEGFLSAESGETHGVAYLRSDNAGETMGKKHFQTWAREGGVWLETSNPGQQWQNGKAERIGGLIWKGGESLRYAANLPSHYWPFACRAFTHQRNRLPTARCPDKTPFEVFEGLSIPQLQQIEHFRVFGSLAYVVVHPDERVGKTAATERAMMLGYSDEPGSEHDNVMGSKKGYIVRRLSDGKIFPVAYKQLFKSYENVFLFPKPNSYDLFLKREIKNNSDGLVASALCAVNSLGGNCESKHDNNEPNTNALDEQNKNSLPLGMSVSGSVLVSESDAESVECGVVESVSKEKKTGERASGENDESVSWGELNERASVGMPPLEVPTPYLTRSQGRENLSNSVLGAEDEWLRSELGDNLHGKLFPSEVKYSEKSGVSDSGSSSEGKKGSKAAAAAGETQSEVGSSESESVEEEGKDEVRGVHSFKRTGKRQHGREYLVEWRGLQEERTTLVYPLLSGPTPGSRLTASQVPLTIKTLERR